jgi:cyanophycinase
MKTCHASCAILIAMVSILLIPLNSLAQAPKGHLFIIGGGERSVQMMRQFVDLAGGPDKAKVVIIPNASGDPDTACIDMTAEFHSLGVRNVDCVRLTRDQASDPHSIERLNGATGVYFTGGDQIRVTKALEGTMVHKKLLDLYHAGAVMGGTSAGAALMSEVMITGDERLNKDTVRGFLYIKRDNVVTVEGMGFLTNVIIDQHFVARKRHNRLISVVLEHPDLVGVGIDEATAIIVRPNGTFEVTGESNVIVYDATHAEGIRTGAGGHLSGHDIRMHVLTSGDVYDMTNGTVRSAGDRK